VLHFRGWKRTERRAVGGKPQRQVGNVNTLYWAIEVVIVHQGLRVLALHARRDLRTRRTVTEGLLNDFGAIHYQLIKPCARA
jgi:hypothetical protein